MHERGKINDDYVSISTLKGKRRKRSLRPFSFCLGLSIDVERNNKTFSTCCPCCTSSTKNGSGKAMEVAASTGCARTMTMGLCEVIVTLLSVMTRNGEGEDDVANGDGRRQPR